MSSFEVRGQNEALCVGRILGPHGIYGFVKVESFTQNPRDLFSFPFLKRGEAKVKMVLKQMISRQGPAFVAQIEGVTCRTSANTFKGQYLLVEIQDLGALKGPHGEDCFYQYELMGLKVRIYKAVI